MPEAAAPVSLLDLKAQYALLREDLQRAIAGVFEDGQFILGPRVEALEKEVAKYVGVPHAVGMSSGTDALLACLMALDIGPGDEVLVPTFSFFATAGVVTRLGARPVFVDLDPVSYNLDPAAAAERVSAKTRAIIPVHLFGLCAEMDAIEELCLERGIAIVEDACQAIGSEWKGRMAGSIGTFGCFSFFPTKNLGGAGDGGMVVTHDDKLAARLRRMRVHGMEPKYYHHEVGGNFRLDALQAAILSVKLPYLDRWIKDRRTNAERYTRMFAADPAFGTRVVTPVEKSIQFHSYHQYVIRVPERDRMRAFLAARGVAAEVYYPVPLHLQECFKSLGAREGDFPHAERAARQVLALPIYPELTESQQVRVVEAIRDFLVSI